MDIDDVDVPLITAAARGCDRCGGHFHGGRITIKGDAILSVLCNSCFAIEGGRTLH